MLPSKGFATGEYSFSYSGMNCFLVPSTNHFADIFPENTPALISCISIDNTLYPNQSTQDHFIMKGSASGSHEKNWRVSNSGDSFIRELQLGYVPRKIRTRIAKMCELDHRKAIVHGKYKFYFKFFCCKCFTADAITDYSCKKRVC